MIRSRPITEVASTGRYLPDRVLTNADWARMVDTDDKWIVERTGIRERRIASPCTSVCDMGTSAAEQALERAGVSAMDVDLLLVSTATPDRLLPSTACDIQARIGANKAAAMDISAACTGYLYILALAEGYIASGMGEVVLVVSTEKMTSIMDWEDRSTAVPVRRRRGRQRDSSGERRPGHSRKRHPVRRNVRRSAPEAGRGRTPTL